MNLTKCFWCYRFFFKYFSNKRKFCSVTCKYLSSSKKIYSCLNCNFPFIRKKTKDIPKFCSRKCSIIGQVRNSGAKIGHTVSKKTRQKLKKALMGRKVTWADKIVKTRKERGGYLCKENNPMWRGGVTSENEKIRKSNKYLKWRKQIFEKDNYTCQECDKRGGKLIVDHIKPFAFFKKERLSIENGRVLCILCNKNAPTTGGRVFSFMREKYPEIKL